METAGFNLDYFLQKYKIPVVLALFGLILLGIGILSFKVLLFENNELEIIQPVDEELGEAKIVVEIAGAVQKPGVYELGAGSRINDLLVLAGGLSAEADRDWLAKNINLAQKLIDGAKIYLPKTGEVKVGKEEVRRGLGSERQEIGKININTASQKELESLWGIGPITAKKIIENRPYQKIEDLISKKIVKSNVWEEIKDKVTVW